MPGFSGAEGMALVRLVFIKQAVWLESKGMRATAKAPLQTPIMRKRYGLPRNAPHSEVLSYIEEELEVLRTVADKTPGAWTK